ncbi:hypothetical protein PHAVU_003G060401 [Phaseolus vulgaris]
MLLLLPHLSKIKTKKNIFKTRILLHHQSLLILRIQSLQIQNLRIQSLQILQIPQIQNLRIQIPRIQILQRVLRLTHHRHRPLLQNLHPPRHRRRRHLKVHHHHGHHLKI